jgi:opacity protein-like surface antigen
MNIRRLAAVIGAAALAVSALAAQEKPATPSVAGTWKMTVDAGPHGVTTMGLVLEQKGATVTGTFASPHGDMPVNGEFADGTLKLATTAEHADSQITFEARFTDERTLSGYVSSEMGDMKFTAQRVKDKP